MSGINIRTPSPYNIWDSSEIPFLPIPEKENLSFTSCITREGPIPKSGPDLISELPPELLVAIASHHHKVYQTIVQLSKDIKFKLGAVDFVSLFLQPFCCHVSMIGIDITTCGYKLPNGSYHGVVIKKDTNTGIIRSETTYDMGDIKHESTYYRDGSLHETIQYKDSNRDGEYLEYDQSGKLKCKGSYSEGNMHGQWIDYERNVEYTYLRGILKRYTELTVALKY